MEKKPEAVLSIKNVVKKFGGLTAVNNVNLDVYPNEILGIVGDNGAGKSTLIKMVTGVYPPDSGKIYFENEGIDGKSPQEVRNLGIETIYQDLALVGSLDASANVFLGKEVIRNRFMGSLNIKYMREETKSAMEKLAFNLPDLSRAVGFLSGGQQQGVAITRSIYWGKKFLIMDEPTAALGVKESIRVLNIILEAVQHVKAIIIIAHNIDHVIKVATRVVVMRNASIVSEIDCVKHENKDYLHNEIVAAITGKDFK
jgi:simple sugar transport system ATP-binding protein